MNARGSAALALLAVFAAACGEKKPPVAPPAAPPARTEAALRAFQEAEKAIRTGKTSQAAQFYREAVDADPAFFLAWARWHELSHATGNGDAARTEFQRRLSAAPEDPLWLTLNAIADPAGREERIRKAIALAPGFAWAHYALAETLVEAKRADEALRAAERALQIDPGNGLFHLQRASALLWADRPRDAREETRRAKELLPEDERPFVIEAQALLDENNLDGAIGQLEEAVRLAPAAASPRAVLCDLRVKRGTAHLAEFQRHFSERHFGAAQRAAEEGAGLLEAAVRENPEHPGAKKYLPMAEGAAAAAALGRAGAASEARETADLIAACTEAAGWLAKAASRLPSGESADYVADGFLKLGGLRMTAAQAQRTAGGPEAGRAQDLAALAAFESCLVLRPGSTTAARMAEELRQALGR